MSLLTKTPNKYATYTPRMLNMIMTRYQNRKDSESQLDVAKQLLADFNQLWAGSDNIAKLTATSITQKYTREHKRLASKRKKNYAAKKAVIASSQSAASLESKLSQSVPKESKQAPVSATLRGYSIQKILAADSITITEVAGKLTITLE